LNFRAHSVAPSAQGVADEESMAGTKESKPRFISAIRSGCCFVVVVVVVVTAKLNPNIILQIENSSV